MDPIGLPATAEEARAAVGHLAAADGGVDLIKVVQDRGSPDRPLQSISPDVLEAIVTEAHTHDLPVFAHWGTLDDLDDVLAAGVDGLEHLDSRELQLLVDAGLTPHEALLAATSHAADVLPTDRVGVVEPGRAADLLAVRGDPHDDIATIEDVVAVWRDGRLVIDHRAADRSADGRTGQEVAITRTQSGQRARKVICTSRSSNPCR